MRSSGRSTSCSMTREARISHFRFRVLVAWDLFAISNALVWPWSGWKITAQVLSGIILFCVIIWGFGGEQIDEWRKGEQSGN